MTNKLKKATQVTIIPEQAARAAIPYSPARKAYTETVTETVCVIKESGGDVIWDCSNYDASRGGWQPCINTGKRTPIVRTRECFSEKRTIYHPAVPEVKAQPAIEYRPRTVIQAFGLGWNAGARSIGTLPGNGSATFSVLQAVGTVVGFNDVDEDAGYIGIEHGLFFRRETVRVYESGVAKGSELSFLPTDTFKIERVGSRVRYYQNDTLIYTSLEPSYGTVFLDASMYSGGDTIDSPALLIGAMGGYSHASMLPLDGFASEGDWNYSRGKMLPMTGSASALNYAYSRNSMRPLTGLAVQGKYGSSRGSMRPLTGQANGGMLVPAYALSATQMMPLYGYAYGPEARFGFSNSAMRAMTGMAVVGKYGESRNTMLPMGGQATDLSFLCFPLVAGGSFSHYAIVTLESEPMVGILGGSVTAGSALSVLPVQAFTGILGGAFTPFPVYVLDAVPMRGNLGGSITETADLVLTTEPMPLLLGGNLGANTWPIGGSLGALHLGAEVFAMNMTGGTTQYDNYPFNSVAKIGGRYYGASEDGLFLLEGDDDAGEPIEAVIGMGQMDFGSPQVKTVTYAYLGAASGNMRLQVDALMNGTPASFTYPARAHGASMRELRFDLGKGLKSSYVMPTFYNTNGEPFEVDAVRFMVAESARRI